MAGSSHSEAGGKSAKLHRCARQGPGGRDLGGRANNLRQVALGTEGVPLRVVSAAQVRGGRPYCNDNHPEALLGS
jgi:hypothetical protein